MFLLLQGLCLISNTRTLLSFEVYLRDIGSNSFCDRLLDSKHSSNRFRREPAETPAGSRHLAGPFCAPTHVSAPVQLGLQGLGFSG